MKRLGDAINATQRMNTVPGFVPWLTAGAGNDFQSGQLLIKQPKILSTSLAVRLPAFPSNMNLFVNGSRRSASALVPAITKLFPSRLIASYSNFPEIFDAPTALHAADSVSAIDVNPADGQEITAVIPFFGDSAFGAALKGSVVVVFKSNSIYLVDLAAKAAGLNPIQRLDSQGKGCTAPYSVANTRNGIMFANDSGIYRLTTQLAVEYIGRKYEKRFRTKVSNLVYAMGTHDGINNTYRLSYTPTLSSSNTDAAVYNHTREYEPQSVSYGIATIGAWSTYNSVPAIGWANLNSSSYYASTSGRVFINRNTGLLSDYRDDSSAINFEVITRGNDFGDGGVRKVVRGIVSHFTGADSKGTFLVVGRDLVDNFDPTDAFYLVSAVPATGLQDTGEKKLNSIMSMINSSKAVYFQLKYTNGALDESVEIVGIDWKVAGIGPKTITQAASTAS